MKILQRAMCVIKIFLKMKVLLASMAKLVTKKTKEGSQEEIKITQKVTEVQEKTTQKVITSPDYYRLVITIIVSVSALSLFTSCNQNELYFDYIKIDKGDWHSDLKAEFTIDTIEFEQIGNYNLFIEITTTALYPYSDINLRIDHNLNDTIFSSDSIRFRLSDDYGKWLGTGVGSLRQLSLLYKSNVYLDTIRSYNVRVMHLMSDEPLNGVKKIGLRVL